MNKKHAFDLKTCIGGLIVNAIQINSLFYDFCYQLTFKKSLKAYADKFKVHEGEDLIEDIEFFQDIDDPFVQHAYKAIYLATDLIQDLTLRHGLDEVECISNEEYVLASYRYQPHIPIALHNKRYAQLLFLLQCFYDSCTLCLYYHTCALTLNSYNIPLQMRVKLDYSLEGSFRFLNLENTDVNVLVETIFAFEEAKKRLNKTIKTLNPYISCPKF